MYHAHIIKDLAMIIVYGLTETFSKKYQLCNGGNRQKKGASLFRGCQERRH